MQALEGKQQSHQCRPFLEVTFYDPQAEATTILLAENKAALRDTIEGSLNSYCLKRGSKYVRMGAHFGFSHSVYLILEFVRELPDLDLPGAGAELSAHARAARESLWEGSGGGV